MTYNVGDRVEYLMQRHWYASTVVRVTEKRVIIIVDAFPRRSRATVPSQLRPLVKL